ncbi:hypothetical protein [Vibrio sp.]|uniref:hypothetical protein n=1 Tax=Vibrio sp. TaxID=678 RepID=UPI00311F49A8
MGYSTRKAAGILTKSIGKVPDLLRILTFWTRVTSSDIAEITTSEQKAFDL